MTSTVSLGQVAYDTRFADERPPNRLPFDQLPPYLQAGWERVAEEVLKAGAEQATPTSGVALNAAAGDVSEVAAGSLEDLVETLERIAAATPFNTNSTSADQMASWCQVVAKCALDRAALLAASKVRENSRGEVMDALEAILEANDDFRASLPPDWDGDPVNDACAAARKVLQSSSQLDETTCCEVCTEPTRCLVCALSGEPRKGVTTKMLVDSIAALRSAPAEQDGGWLPIDDRAKSEKEVDLWVDGRRVTDARWYADKWIYGGGRYQNVRGRPTHYRRVAPPRSLASGSDGEQQA